MSADFDVAIVGAGPAGSWAAYQLAAAGARVVIVDGSHPREKPCGGGLSARALDLLRPVSGVLPASVDTAHARFTTSAGTATVRLRGETPALAVVSRRELDAALLEAARVRGAEHVPRRVVSFARAVRGWDIETETNRLSAAWLVGADGANSLVRRRLATPFGRRDLSVASGYFVRGRTDRDIDIEFTTCPPGYLWSFPRLDHLAVGICGQADETSSRDLFGAARRWIGAHAPAADSALTRYSWPIPSLTPSAIGRERPAEDRWLLTGDAAGLVDPITREGLYFALRSGECAAASLMGRDAATTYAGLLGRHVYPELTRAARMKPRFFAPKFSALLIGALQRSAPISGIMADLVAGRQSYRGLRRRLLLTGELRLALAYLGLTVGRKR